MTLFVVIYEYTFHFELLCVPLVSSGVPHSSPLKAEMKIQFFALVGCVRFEDKLPIYFNLNFNRKATTKIVIGRYHRPCIRVDMSIQVWGGAAKEGPPILLENLTSKFSANWSLFSSCDTKWVYYPKKQIAQYM